MLNLQKLISIGLVSIDAITHFMHNFYLPRLKPCTYTINAEKTALTLYTHAPAGLDTIEKLANFLEIVFSAETLEVLADTIDNIVEDFLQLAKGAKVYELWKHPSYPLNEIIWNREFDEIDRPDKKMNFSLYYVNGHDIDDPLALGITKRSSFVSHIFNMDNYLGKSFYNHQGDYHVLCSARLTLKDFPEVKVAINELSEEDLILFQREQGNTSSLPSILILEDEEPEANNEPENMSQSSFQLLDGLRTQLPSFLHNHLVVVNPVRMCSFLGDFSDWGAPILVGAEVDEEESYTAANTCS
jgi:hypothetical protein